MGFRSFFVCFALGIVTSEASSVTPVDKVIQLLGELSKKVEQEGKAEAAAYDKYACFCKEQADEKLYAIEKSDEKISHLAALIGKLTTEISELDGEIQNLGTKISTTASSIQSNQQTRDGNHAIFVTNLADADNAISAVNRAITALKASKKQLIGKAELEAASLSQVSGVAKTALALRMGLSDADERHLSFLADAGKPGTSYTYQYRSNDIIATLESLRDTFMRRKESVEADEFRAQTAHELTQQALSNQKKFAEKEKREKSELRESKSDQKEAAAGDKAQETNDKNSDQNFLNVLTGECQTKATLWDQRSQSRAAEQTAISKAIEALETGVAPNWKANKKLVGLQRQSTVRGHWVYVQDAAAPTKPVPPAASFIQVNGVSLRGSARSTDAQLADRVHAFLVNSAAKMQSPILSVAAIKVRAAEDHFVKVRQIIKDLIKRLNDDASAEASSKLFCDQELSSAVSKRDSEELKVENYKATINVKESEKTQLKEDIAELSKQIAANRKALLEATTLREEEQTENARTVTDAGAGKEAVQLALTTLETFYTEFLQYVPPNSDRDGLTVGDRAPEVFDSEYNGAQEASKGIIGMLQVILSDFDRTNTTVTTEESRAAGAFDTFKSTNEGDTSIKEGSVTTKEGEITTINDALVTLEDSLTGAKAAHAAANDEIDKLNSMCVAGVETYKERVAQRVKEIEALKEAHAILENWQK